jgi:NitT/TauT family transport system substrate-binding protein
MALWLLWPALAWSAEIRLAISTTPLSAPMIIAIENGYFRQQGLSVVPTLIQGGHRTIAALFAGEADIATSSETVVMVHAFARDDFRVLCTFVSSDNDDKILVATASGIGAVSDLRHRRIGTIRNASAHFFLSQTLQLAGISGREVTIIGIDPENAATMLESGAVDAVAVWEPYGDQLRRRLGPRVMALPHDRAYIETFNAVASAEFIARHPDSVDGILRALIQAVAFIEAAPDKAQAIVAAALKQDPAVVGAVWEDLRFKVGLDQWLLTTLEAEGQWAVAEGLVDRARTPNFLDVLAVEPLDRVKPRAVTLYR